MIRAKQNFQRAASQSHEVDDNGHLRLSCSKYQQCWMRDQSRACCGGRILDFEISRNDGVWVNKFLTQNSTALTLSLEVRRQENVASIQTRFSFLRPTWRIPIGVGVRLRRPGVEIRRLLDEFSAPFHVPNAHSLIRGPLPMMTRTDQND